MAVTTTAQLTTLRNFINADPVLSLLPLGDDTAVQIADAMNTLRSPDYWIWRTSVSKDELTNSTSADGTTFNWTGAGFITRSQGERDAWKELFDRNGKVNPSLASVRQAFSDIFSGGTQPAPANRTHLSTVARRKASIFEHLFRTNTAAGTTANPDILGLEGPLLPSEVTAARSN